MPDEWSSSVITFAAAGDWAKWTFTVPDATAAAHLNGDGFGVNCNFQVRAGLGGASLSRSGSLMVNDTHAKIIDPVSSTSGWVSADRFQVFGQYLTQGFEVHGLDSGQTVTLFPAEPFVVGTNTIRYIANDGFDLDAIQMAYGGSSPLYNFGDDSHAETKPADWDTHVNPSVIPPSGTLPVYRFRAQDATTGHADVRPLELRKWCKVGLSDYVVTLHIEDAAGNPATGTVGTNTGGPTYLRTVLDPNGDVTLFSPNGAQFWYAGSDDVGPATWLPNYSTQPAVNCGGWQVGAVGMSH